MNENESKASSIQEQKAKIRERYKGISSDEIDVIPALPKAHLDDDERAKRVAVYARVSTDDPRQTSSYELQKNHYEDLVNRHPGWDLIDIYADEGISGTSLQHRDSFIRMIGDCKKGKIDLILTKSVSRFARNIVDCISYVRQLSAMKPPVGVYFEAEHIFTLDSNSEMTLSFIATLAQEESHTKSEIMNASIEMRFKRGIFLTPPLLGYDQDIEGNLVINEDEALTVKLIFFMYLYGYSCNEIANKLTELKRLTKRGNSHWSANSVLQQLQNERHCGDVLSRKTWTPSYLDHKSKKNRHDRNQYLKKDHHEAIISRDDFIAVQHMISNAKYGNKTILPKLNVISEGALSGFVIINPRWAGFKPKDYSDACLSVEKAEAEADLYPIKPVAGDFDLRGYEVVRSEYFESKNKISVTISNNQIAFTKKAINSLDTTFINILFHPVRRMIAVKPEKKDGKDAVQWSRMNKGIRVSRTISGAAFLPTLYNILGWNEKCRYKIEGTLLQSPNSAVIIFDVQNAQALIPHQELNMSHDENNGTNSDNIQVIGTKKNALGFPNEWSGSFGHSYYEKGRPDTLVGPSKEGNLHLDRTKSFGREDLPNVTSASTLDKNIKQLLHNMERGETT